MDTVPRLRGEGRRSGKTLGEMGAGPEAGQDGRVHDQCHHETKEQTGLSRVRSYTDPEVTFTVALDKRVYKIPTIIDERIKL